MFDIVIRQIGKLTRAIVHHTHINAFARFSCQDFQDGSPHFAIADDEIFKEDKMPRFFQPDEQFGKLGFARREIDRLCVAIDGETAGKVKIVRQ